MIKIRSILLIIIILGWLIIAEAGIAPTTYISYIDDILGFYKVRNTEQPPRQFTYNGHTLNINQGDTVIWQNDAEKTTFTILNEQNLWNSNVGYLRVGSKMNYKYPRAFCKFIASASHNDVNEAIDILKHTLKTNPASDNMVWDILIETGFKEFNEQAFRQAAIKVLKNSKD